MKKSKKLLSLLLTLSILISPAMVTDAKAAPAALTAQSNYLDITTSEAVIAMEVGQKIEVRNLVFRKTGDEEKPLDYCKSSSGFKAKSSDSKVASVKNGVITAVKEGKARVSVTKNGKRFIYYITVKKPQYTLTAEYKAVNSYLNALSKKYPNKASVKGKETSLVKGVSELTDRIYDYKWVILWGEDLTEEYDLWDDPIPFIFLSGVFDNTAAYHLCLENPREYFRLAEMADEYIDKKAKKAKDLKIKSVSVKKDKDNRWGDNWYDVSIKLKKPLDSNQIMRTYEMYNPYYSSGEGLPATKNWKKNLKALYYGDLVRVLSGGREDYEDPDVYVFGTYGDNVLTCSVQLKKKGTYKIYFYEIGGSDKRKYCATFKVK